MRRNILSLLFAGCLLNTAFGGNPVPLEHAQELSGDVPWYEPEMLFAQRGKIGSYALPPSSVAVGRDPSVTAPNRDTKAALGSRHAKSIRVAYERKGVMSFCGAYAILLVDMTPYQTLTFKVKGAEGGESFEIGLNDLISNKREDGVFAGSIYRYLPNGITKEWQEVKIPISDFFGPNLSHIYSIVFAFTEKGSGKFWIDDICLHEELLVNREAEIEEQGYMLLDNFDHCDLNLLGRKSQPYHALPSTCLADRVPDPAGDPDRGRVMQLDFARKSAGWCGYYTLLNQIDGAFYDLTDYESVSFDVMGKHGGEQITLGLADRNWLTIGDSLRAGNADTYLPEGITTEWQTMTIPLKDFGQLDLTEMGAFVVNFSRKDESVLYIDNIRFNLKQNSEVVEDSRQ
jgi:hypothetical protein